MRERPLALTISVTVASLTAAGAQQMVDRVAGIEKRLGIYDLGQVTPRL